MVKHRFLIFYFVVAVLLSSSLLRSFNATEHNAVAPYVSAVGNSQIIALKKIAYYCAPYVGVLALRFATTLAHEWGHAYAYWMITKKWPSITIGNNEVKENLVFSTKNLQLFMPNSDTLSFPGVSDLDTNPNPFFDAFISLTGPAVEMLVIVLLLPYVASNLFRYVLKEEYFDEIDNLLSEGDSDGFYVFKALHLPMTWLNYFDTYLSAMLHSAFELLYVAELVQLRLFCLLFKHEHEVHRVLILVRQYCLYYLLPLFCAALKNLFETGMHGLVTLVDQAEKLSDDVPWLEPWWKFSRWLLNYVFPITLIYQIITWNKQYRFHEYLIKYT